MHAHTHMKSSPDKKEKFLTVLDQRRTNNILIEIKRFPAARHIKAAILNMDYSYFNKEIVEVCGRGCEYGCGCGCVWLGMCGCVWLGMCGCVHVGMLYIGVSYSD